MTQSSETGGRAVSRRARAAALAITVALMAAAAGVLATTPADSVPARLLGVSAQGGALVVEASEPVTYSVTRPNPNALVLDLRNVTVADARNELAGGGSPDAAPPRMIKNVTIEQATAADGRAVARVHVALVQPAQHDVRSSRNTIRVELMPEAPAGEIKTRNAKTASVARAGAPPIVAAPAAVVSASSLDRIRSSRQGDETTITLSGNGHLVPARVSESDDQPRRLILDFPNVTASAPRQTAIDSALVKRVRVALNSADPLVTRVVMEITPGATYRLERSGEGGRDVAVIFAQVDASAPAAPSSALPVEAVRESEPVLTLEQAMANLGALTPPEPAANPAAVLSNVRNSPAPPAGGARPMLVTPPASRATAAPPASRPAAPQTPAPPQPVLEQPQPPAPVDPPVPVPPAPAPGLRQSGDPAQRQFTGHTISLDFEGGDLRAVLRLFSDVSGLNMVIDPDVQGTVDIKLTDVPWDQALDVILRGNQLDYTVDGTIVRISKLDTLRKEQDARQALAKAAADAGNLLVRTYPLSYAKAAQAAPLIKRAALSQRGDVQIDERTNMLIITDLAARHDTAVELIGTIDRAEPQVEIEARIVTTTREFAKVLGVQWGLNGRMTPEIGNTTGLAFPNNGSLGGRLGTQGAASTEQAPASDPRASALNNAGTAVNLGAAAATSAIGLALGAVNGAFNLDVALSALERTGKGRILSTPRVTTQNNVEAEITQGVQIPVQTEANNTVTVTFKDAALTLRVTPQITNAGTVIMQIQLENATPGPPVQGIPSIDTQRANTRVQVADGMTTVMGGIFVTNETSTVDRTPVLHRLPLLGWLFRRDDNFDQSRELLIFITPRIMKG